MPEAGLQATVEESVGESMTALALGSGDVPVLGTPAIVALVERAARAALSGHLGDGETSVGTQIELSHSAPTREGSTVHASARLTRVDGRRLTFEVEVRDRRGVVASGTHRRAIVDRGDFMSSAVARGEESPG